MPALAPPAAADPRTCGRTSRRLALAVVAHVMPASEGGFLARAVGDPIFTAADTLQQLEDAVRDAVACHFDEGCAPGVVRVRLEGSA
jgi:hypothetical protein